jgi:hypothetical protein
MKLVSSLSLSIKNKTPIKNDLRCFNAEHCDQEHSPSMRSTWSLYKQTMFSSIVTHHTRCLFCKEKADDKVS